MGKIPEGLPEQRELTKFKDGAIDVQELIWNLDALAV